MINCTIKLALVTKPQNDESWVTYNSPYLPDQRSGNPTCPERLGINTCNSNPRATQHFGGWVALNGLLEQETRASYLHNSALNCQQVIEPGRPMVIHGQRSYREDQSSLAQQCVLFDPTRPQPFGTRALHEF